LLYNEKRRQRQRGEIAAAAHDFIADAQLDPKKPVIHGKLQGLEICFRLTTRGAGSSAENWTECDVKLDTDWFVLELAPQDKHEQRFIADGLRQDTELGDEAFDDRFVVEAAPSGLAGEVLDAPLRARLSALHPVALEPIDDGLRLAKKGWIEDQDAIRSFAELAATLGSRIERAREHTSEARHAAQHGKAAIAGYRGSAHAANALEHTTEVEGLRALRKRRARHVRFRMIAIMAASVALVVLLGLAKWKCG
jgi:hypothetical protein